jgi:uncharacterized protein
MAKPLSIIAVGLFIVLTASAAEAASFDCRAATTLVERMICADPHLSEKDEHLARAYKAALQVAPGHADAIRMAQRQWLKHLATCSDASCIAAAQEQRLAELESKPTGSPAGPQVGDKIIAGEHHTITVIAVGGIGSRHAAIDGKLTEQDAASFCQGYVGEAAATPKCIADWMKEVGTETKEFRADCQTGLFSVFGTRLAFLGRNAAASPDKADIDEPTYLIRLLETGEILQDMNATGYPLFLSSFQSLCPGVAERAPLVDRPIAFPDCSNPELLRQARETAVSAGYPHLMNVKIIDLTDIRTVSTSATEERCVATVMLNTSERLTLFYRSFVQNHKVFLETRLTP